MKSWIVALISLFGLPAFASETPVFVSCYSDSGEHLQLIFDTAQTQFSYRYAKIDSVDEFEAAPSGPIGAASSRVTVSIPEDQQHIELRAHIVAEMPSRPSFRRVWK